jgi:hypothetical protein
MTWISLVCLLALSSSALGRSAYGGGYGAAPIQQLPSLLNVMRDQTIQQPILPPQQLPTQGYGQQPQTIDWSSVNVQQDVPISLSSYGSSLPKSLPVQSYGQVNQGYGGMSRILSPDQQPAQVQPVQILTPADLLCRGQQPEVVIPLENGRKFVVCLDDSKGVEQKCPKGLFYHPTSRRCERKLGPLENLCVSQPCLNGGQCTPVDSSFQCQCAPGFDGKTCELDARVCQTQQPCGQSPDARCQSFRLGAALQYICILQDGLAYGLTAQQAVPSPCQDIDGPQALTVSNKGFIMCDGERLFVESCPGGTVWDDLNKACVWPDMQATAPQLDQQQSYGQSYGQSSYGQARQIIPQATYGSQIPIQQFAQSYGPQIPITKPLIAQRQFFQGPSQSYGSQITVPQQKFFPAPAQPYGTELTVPQQKFFPAPAQSYGSQIAVQPPQIAVQPPVPEQTRFFQPPTQSYGSQIAVQPPVPEQPKFFQAQTQSYGSQIAVQPPVPEQTKVIQSSGY